MVAPLAGAWIEILLLLIFLPKLVVAPLAGAWIEISYPVQVPVVRMVAPLAGAWIEIPTDVNSIAICLMSLPSRERGLKLR